MTMTVRGRAVEAPAPVNDPTVEDPTVRGRWWIVVAVLAAVIPAIGGVIWWYLAAGPGAYTVVPDGLVASTVAEAQSTLDDAGLAVETVEVFHPTVASGEVVDLEPAAGEEIRKGGLVTLTVSKGPEMRQVRTVGAGEALDDAAARLTAAGLDANPRHAYSDTVAAGTIIAMTLADGTRVENGDSLPKGTEVVLFCSDGPAPVTIPTVVGLTRDQALAALSAAGLQVTESQAYHPDVPAGIVKVQDPAGGTAGHRLDTVAIIVSLGPEPPPPPTTVVIPRSVVGMTKFPALDLLERKGFNARYERGSCTVEWAQCVVYKTVPAAGTSRAKGSTVTIWLTNPAGTQVTTGTVPSLVGMDKYPAWDAIYDAGFNGVHYDEGCTNLATLGYEGCAVDRQNPAPGTSLAKGSTIEIWLRNK